VSAEVYAEGLEYARLGQTRRIEFENGAAEASVQGRMSRPYPVTLRLKHFSAEDRDRIIESMADQALYAAKLLAREVPANIEDLFAPLDLKLFPPSRMRLRPVVTAKSPSLGVSTLFVQRFWPLTYSVASRCPYLNCAANRLSISLRC